MSDFELFEAQLDILCEEKLGMGLACLPDMPTRDWFDDGMETDEAFEDLVERLEDDGMDLSFLDEE